MSSNIGGDTPRWKGMVWLASFFCFTAFERNKSSRHGMGHWAQRGHIQQQQGSSLRIGLYLFVLLGGWHWTPHSIMDGMAFRAYGTHGRTERSVA